MLSRVAVARAAMAALELGFDPREPRDARGRWTDAPGVGVAEKIADASRRWAGQAGGAEIGDGDLYDWGAQIGNAMRERGESATDPIALYRAADEVTPNGRAYIEELDRRYGTSMAQQVQQELESGREVAGAAAEGAESVAAHVRSKPDAGVTGFPERSIAETADAWRTLEADWSASQKDALKAYTGLAYLDINRALREGRPLRGSDLIERIQSAMRPSPQSQTVYRRATGRAFGASEYATADDLKALEGQTLESPGFMSTAVDGSVLEGHQAVVSMEIEVPRGTSSAYVSDTIGIDTEGELVLDAGTQYEIISVEPINEFETRMKVRVVG